MEKDNCFPHALQAWDLSWRFSVPLTTLYRSFDFTDSGIRLLLDGQPHATTNYLRKSQFLSLHGKIDGKYEFTQLLMLNTDNSVSGFYWYPKVGKLIDFEGKRSPDGSTLELQEDGGRFVIQLSTEGLTGVWYNAQGQEFPIVFH